MRKIIIYIGVLLLMISFASASTFISNNSTFDLGTYSLTFRNNSGFVQLNDSLSYGTYVSKVFDASGEATWNNISWTQDVCYKCEFPDYKGNDSGDYIRYVNMTGIIVLMHMNAIDGPTIIDYSGEGNNATYNGWLYNESGVLNASIGFDGVNDYFNFGDKFDAEGPMTWELWVKRNGAGAGSRWPFIDKWYDGTNADYSFALLGYNSLSIFFRDSGNNNFGGTFDIPSTDKKFVHIAITFDAVDLRIYADGEYIGIINVGDIGNDNNADFTLAKYNHPAGGWFKGWIDEFALWNRSLSAEEVRDHYKRGRARFNVSVRSCDDAACSGESFSALGNVSPQSLSVIDNRYFQYNFTFTNTSQSLYNVTIDYLGGTLTLTNLNYAGVSPVNDTNTFTWDTNAIANSSLRVNNTALGIDNTTLDATLVTSHSLDTIILDQIGTYDFYVESCTATECVNSSGSFDVVEIDINYDLAYTNYMRGYTIDSTVNANELKVNYTEGGVLTSGNVIECYLSYPNTTVARSKVNLTDLGDGNYNHSNYYNFSLTDPSGIYVQTCTNLNNSLIKTQNLNISITGTCNITALSRELNQYLNYTFNETFIDIRDTTIYNTTEIIQMSNNGSYLTTYSSNNNSYSCQFDYTVDSLGLSTDYLIYNYIENISVSFSQPSISVKDFQSGIYQASYDLSGSPDDIAVTGSFSTGYHDLRAYNITTNLSQYYFQNTSIQVTSATLQTVSYTNSYAYDTGSNLCLDSILVRNSRNDTNLPFSYVVGGYGTNGTCLLDVSAQSPGTYNFTVASTLNDGLNVGNNITYSYTITSGNTATILELRVGGMNDEGRWLVRDNVTLYIKVSDPESDSVNILSVWIWHYKFTPVMNFTPYNVTLTTNSTGIWHTLTFNSTFELGHGSFPATQIEINITGGSKKRTVGFLVDNSYRPEDIWYYNGRYINGEII